MEQVRKDKVKLNLQLSENEIMTMSQDKFRRLVISQTKVLTIKSLNELTSKRSKSANIRLSTLQTNLNKEEIQTLHKLKYRMINVKKNFSSKYKDNIWCRTFFLFPETQQHLTVCPILKTKLTNLIDFSKLDHQMVFQNLRRQETFTKQYLLLLKGRDDLLNENSDDK